MTPWEEIVGAEHVAPPRDVDAVAGVHPASVVRPGSIAEVQACVRLAAARGLALVACSLGGHLDMGAPPTKLDVLLRLDRLARIADHQAADMTVTVEAGCPLPLLAATLARAGQWLPLDPPRPEITSVGGLIAANLSGPLRASQGRVRDLLIGIRVVGADGDLVAGGGRVVKNVAGYDLPKLHVGALGTVGVIVEATFKVRPKPACEEAVLIIGGDPRELSLTAHTVLDGPIPPLWLEIAGPAVLGADAVLGVGLGGIAEEVAAAREVAMQAAAADGFSAIPVADGAAWRARFGAFATCDAPAILRAAVWPKFTGHFMERVLLKAIVPIAGHVASGVARIAVHDPSAVRALVDAHRSWAEGAGGSFVIERATPAARQGLDVWGSPGAGLELMRRVKRAFDPDGVLGPGRFVGGI